MVKLKIIFIVFDTRKYELTYPFGLQEYAIQYSFTGVSLVIDWRHFVIKIQRDKTMADNLKYIPNDDTQNYPFCRLQLVVESFGHST